MDRLREIMIMDNKDECYDIYIFDEDVVKSYIKTIIRSVKLVKSNDWTLLDIEKCIKEHLSVEKVIHFDFGIDNIIDINLIK